MAKRFTQEIIEDLTVEGVGSTAAATGLAIATTFPTIGITLIMGRSGASISGHNWWVLGPPLAVTVQGQEIMGDLLALNVSTIKVNINLPDQVFPRNSRCTAWRCGREAIAAGAFTVQVGPENHRQAIKDHDWTYRLSIEVLSNVRGAPVPIQTPPPDHGQDQPAGGPLQQPPLCYQHLHHLHTVAGSTGRFPVPRTPSVIL